MGEQEKTINEEKKEVKEETPQPQQKKKINKMSLEEIEAQLQMVKEKMGGFDSLYAQHLLRRREILLSKSKK